VCVRGLSDPRNPVARADAPSIHLLGGMFERLGEPRKPLIRYQIVVGKVLEDRENNALVAAVVPNQTGCCRSTYQK